MASESSTSIMRDNNSEEIDEIRSETQTKDGENICNITTNENLLHLLEYDPHHRRNLFNEKYLINFMDIMADGRQRQHSGQEYDEHDQNKQVDFADDEHLFEEVAMMLRKRRGWTAEDTLCTNELDLLGDDDDVLAEEEDDAGCPLPSTPEDTQLIEAEVRVICFAN